MDSIIVKKSAMLLVLVLVALCIAIRLGVLRPTTIDGGEFPQHKDALFSGELTSSGDSYLPKSKSEKKRSNPYKNTSSYNSSFWKRVSNDEFLGDLTPKELRQFSDWMSTARTDLKLTYLGKKWLNQSALYKENKWSSIPNDLSNLTLDEVYEFLWHDSAPPNSSCISEGPPCCGGDTYTRKWDASEVRTALDSIDLLKSRGIHSMAIMGDSISGQWIGALLYMLQRENVQCPHHTIREEFSNGKNLTLNMAEELPWTGQWSIYTCSGFRFWLLLQNSINWLSLNDDPLAVLHKYDIDAFAIGHGLHQHNETEYEKEMSYILDRAKHFISTPRVHDGGKRLVIMRETVAQHFRTSTHDGSFENRIGSSCSHSSALVPGWRNDIMRNVVAAGGGENSTLIIEHFHMATKDRYDAHIQSGDCTHFCYCPLFWEGVFTSFYDDLVDAWDKHPM